ncbi:MAG: ABC transporter permease [Rhizobiaceae bacterium]
MSTIAARVERPVAPAKPWTNARYIGWSLVALWFVLLGGLALWMFQTWNPELIEKYYPKYKSGLFITIQLVIASIVFGALFSFPLAMMRMSKSKILNGISYAYVYFFRGTPLLLQTFLIYYGLGEFRPQLESVGLWWFFKEAWYCAVFAFTLNTAAYQAEILRGAIESVGKGQWEGAASLGIPKWLTFFKIILPQAFIVALRPYGNEIILMIKGSAVVALITVYDLMGETRRAYARSFDFQTYIWAALIYFSIVTTMQYICDAMERRLTRHLIR